MACRAAGGNDSPEQLWQSILAKKDASGAIPAMRWEPYRRRDARNVKVLNETTSRGYFIDALENFDPSFFGISPKEAEQMDPQQRISMEVAWEALENAGIPPQSLSGTQSAVYWGVNSDDYSKLLLEDLPNIEAWMGIGTAYCGVPNRISYHLNLMGPSTAVDAACASSLVAIHHGRQAILLDETKVAIVGGVNALCGPGLTRVLDKAGAVSPEGCCRSFDDSARGYGRGEGAGAVILKNLKDAIADNDRILAVLKGTAVAQDGRTNGIMAPNADAQELVARNALKVAGIDPITVGYVEAHATSTPLGDPTEVSAISSVYGTGRPKESPCFIGSIKPNIGHLEAGAGVMSFIKAVLTINKGILPPQANLTNLNSSIRWEDAGVRVVQNAIEWPVSDKIRRAGVCSYGYGGTVSHAVIEEFIPNAVSWTDSEQPGSMPTILLLSAPQERRLTSQAEKYRSWFSMEGLKHNLESIATTLATRRGHHDYRAALVVGSHEEAANALEAVVQGSNHAWTAHGRKLGPDVSRDTVWVFSGHGAQWKEMGRDMLKNPVYFQTIVSVDDIVQAEMGFSAVNALQAGDFESSERVQVLTYIMQIGLSSVLKNKGIVPQAIIGHSVGEIAASVVSGALTPEEGALIVCRRALIYRQVVGLGSMILVSKSFIEIEQELFGREDITVAIDASPSSCVVSGLSQSVRIFAEGCTSRGIKTFMVKTDIAFHSPMLQRLVDPLVETLSGILFPRSPTTRLYSTTLEDPRGEDLRDVQYWAANMVKPVRLTTAVDAAIEDNHRVFLEISSHPLVTHSINETMIERGIDDYAVIPTLMRSKPSEKSILYSIAQLHCKGVGVDWKRQMPGPWLPEVPVASWSHRPIWKTIETGPLNPGLTLDVEKHTLLGQRMTIASRDTVVYVTKLDERTKPFPGNHPLHGTEIVPAAALINTFIHGTRAHALHNVKLRVPVAISAPREIQVVVHQDQVMLASRLVQNEQNDTDPQSSWITHTTAHWSDERTMCEKPEENIWLDVPSIKSRIDNQLKDNFSIGYLEKVGVSAMGFPWAISDHWGNTREMIAKVDVAPEISSDAPLPWDPHSWAPILDAATSIGSTIFFDEPRLRMPAQIDQVTICNRGTPPKIGWLYVEDVSDATLTVHVSVLSEDGKLLAKLQGMRFSEIEGTPGVCSGVESLVHQLAWPPAPLAESSFPLGQAIFVTSDRRNVENYVASLSTKIKSTVLPSAQDLSGENSSLVYDSGTAIIYVPGQVDRLDDVAKAAENFTSQLLDIINNVVRASLPSKVFVITSCVAHGETPTALAQSPLHGLSRVIASEQPDNFGGLIDTEDSLFPLQAIKYVQGGDVIRISDGVARLARLRPLPREKLLPKNHSPSLLPRPEGTYLITGGLGALGSEVADFLVQKGARRLILISRRSFPLRKDWDRVTGPMAIAVEKVRGLENRGATVHVLALDIGAKDACQHLSAAIDSLSLPPVLGIVHAAGVLEDQLVHETTRSSVSRVLSPKIGGALTLHALFPPGTLDFFVLFSSCGQLFGFPGQSSYASGNAFLDTLAVHRRSISGGGDNTVAFQWTSWHGLGMASSTEFISAELESKGITDVSRDDAFRAWCHVARYNTDHAVVLRSQVFDQDEPLPVPILSEIAVRRASSASAVAAGTSTSNDDRNMPTSGPELSAYLETKIRECVAAVLHSTLEDVDPRSALSDLGVDSVMTVALRGQLQRALKIKVPPTLTWNHPTVGHLVRWFEDRVRG